jgi:hypothetical protein
LALAVLAFPASTAFAQAIFRPGAGATPRGIEGRATEDDDIYHCQGAPGGSRVRANCEFETETATFEMQQRLKIALKAPQLPGEQCGATTSTEYSQRDTIARVSGTLQITDCAAASGAFTVAVRVKDDSGAETPLEFRETWQRAGAEDVAFTADYPIGENMELVNVRLRGLSCTCADAASAPPPLSETDSAVVAQPTQEPL